MKRRRKLFEDILDDIEARSANAKQKLIDDSEENEIDPYDVCTDTNEDLDVGGYQQLTENMTKSVISC